MAFVLLFLGSILLVVGVRGTQDEFSELIRDLFTGENNLTFWAIAIIAVGSLGYVPALRKMSIAFMALVLISLLIGNQRFFTDLVDQIRSGTRGTQLRGTIDTDFPFPESGSFFDFELGRN